MACPIHPAYCRRLRQRLDELAPGRHAYLVIEKILGAGESLPTDWGVDGTSGYDFMNEVSALQHDAASATSLGRLWHERHAAAPPIFMTRKSGPAWKSWKTASTPN